MSLQQVSLIGVNTGWDVIKMPAIWQAQYASFFVIYTFSGFEELESSDIRGALGKNGASWKCEQVWQRCPVRDDL